MPDLNRRFTVPPAQPGCAFLKRAGIDLRLVLSAHHERVVRSGLGHQGRLLARHDQHGTPRDTPTAKGKAS